MVNAAGAVRAASLREGVNGPSLARHAHWTHRRTPAERAPRASGHRPWVRQYCARGEDVRHRSVAYRIEVAAEAEGDLRALQKRDQQQVRAALPRYLAETPGAASHARKPLDANPFAADWELRLGDLRVLYAIDEARQAVSVLRVGRKVRERLYLRGVPVETRLP